MQKTKSASTTRKDKSKEVRLRRPQPGNLRQNIPTPNKVLTACCRKGGCSLGGMEGEVALCQCGWKVSHKLDYSNVNFNFDHVRSNLIAIQILLVHTSSQSVVSCNQWRLLEFRSVLSTPPKLCVRFPVPCPIVNVFATSCKGAKIFVHKIRRKMQFHCPCSFAKWSYMSPLPSSERDPQNRHSSLNLGVNP